MKKNYIGYINDLILRGMLNYQKSNKITTISFPISENAKMYVKVLLESGDEQERQKFGDALLDELADGAEIDIVRLKISNAKQWHKKYANRTVFRQLGYYRPKSRYIYINNRTAVRGKIVAPKTFLNILLHEWMHHYDTQKIKLISIHTRGFYERLKDLKNKLRIF